MSTFMSNVRGDGVVAPELAAASFYQRTAMTTPTYDGSGEATHPAVLRFEGGWRGWRYWMAMTPLAGNDEALENPSILVSNDGTTWQVPPGLTNPVEAGGTSDPDLVFWDDRLYLFWRKTTVAGDAIHVTSTSDGITWSGDTSIITGANGALLSPAVIRDTDGTWRLWAVNMAASPNTLRMWTASDPLGTWSGPSACTASDPEGRDLWHLSVVRTQTGYLSFMTTCTSGTSGGATRLLLGSSSNATTWSFSSAVLGPSGSGFDANGVYRSSGVFEQDRWRVWYGAFTGSPSPTAWRIGYTEVDPLDFP